MRLRAIFRCSTERAIDGGRLAWIQALRRYRCDNQGQPPRLSHLGRIRITVVQNVTSANASANASRIPRCVGGFDVYSWFEVEACRGL